MFSVLMVCSGNICRSPIAEQLLRAKTLGLPIVLSSAGVIAKNGIAMTEEAAEMSFRFGGEPRAHLSRRLTEEQLVDAELVLTATRAHRSAVVKLLPRTSKKTFTISEFARLVGAVPSHEREAVPELAALVEAARSLRGFVPPPDEPNLDDIEDPYGQPFEVYESVAARIDAELSIIAKALSSPIRES